MSRTKQGEVRASDPSYSEFEREKNLNFAWNLTYNICVSLCKPLGVSLCMSFCKYCRYMLHHKNMQICVGVHLHFCVNIFVFVSLSGAICIVIINTQKYMHRWNKCFGKHILHL